MRQCAADGVVERTRRECRKTMWESARRGRGLLNLISGRNDMKTKQISSLSVLFALAFTSAALALSAPPTEPPAPGGDGPKPGGGERKRPKFEDLDKNNDGFITEDEVTKEQWERIKKRDKDNDGKVSKDEFGAPRPGGGGPRPGGGGEPRPGSGPKPN